MLAKNLKYLRKSKNLTQKEVAAQVGVGRTSLINYEQGKNTPRVDTVDKIARLFNVSQEELMHEHLEEKASKKGYSLRSSNDTSIYIRDEAGIPLIPATAKAGYTQGYADSDYLASLPRIHLPELRHGNFRAFTIEGDSMPPIHSGFIVIGKAVENKSGLTPTLRYIFVTKSEGILFKRLSGLNEREKRLMLSSDNPDYPTFDVKFEEILEIWSFHLFIGYPNDYESPLMGLEWRIDRLMEMVKDLTVNSQK